MAVYVHYLDGAVPEDYGRNHENFADDHEVIYEYEVLESGAVRVLRSREGWPTVVDTVVGPHAYLTIKGRFRGDPSA
ncbi:hypothetical protein J7I98_04405 [Streptomyces sp. ISL-98]|uniref:hypothetical protein n=1 Tax=Streptomyces sp. ISL-98 TaxID=2819192 RepID=UPI001BE9E468|nr:hypothetical protein [Streptomyces sp. ISL-98]MBT2505150.1 hypothetical protein [Streptomyces sp. ISL-98]